MALHPDFPTSPHAILDPAIRWFPADEAMRDTTQVATLAAGPLRWPLLFSKPTDPAQISELYPIKSVTW